MTFSYSSKPQTHYLAVLLGVLVIILIALTFLTFAFGSYTVFNNPDSNVIAQTTKTSGGGAILTIQGASFANNAQRIVWIDPQFSSSNPSLVIASSGFEIGTVNTTSQGYINPVNLTISSSNLTKINSDGFSPHSVWIIGNGGFVPIGSTRFINVTVDSQQNYTAASAGSGIYFFVSLFVFVLPVNFTYGQLFIALWTIYILLFAVALNGPFRNILSSLKQSARTGVSGLLSNSAMATFIVFPIALWGSVILAELQQSAGIPTGALPPTDPLVEFIELALAPLREEIGFRVIPIGIVALLILFSRRRIKDGLLALWHPSRYLKRNDSPSDFRRHQILMYILVVIAAVIFGAAHVLLGAGWDIGKVSQAAAVGLALGVLYYRYGFAATVLLHWAFDFVVDAYTLNNAFVNMFLYYELFSIVVAVGGTIALIVILIHKIQKPPGTFSAPAQV
jgi:hypothetical protein